MQAGIELRHITKRYGADASVPLVVKGLDLVVPHGTLTTLLGPSGCGKTTVLRMIAGLEAPTSGQILIGGRDVTALSPAERNVSMVFQSYALFPNMNVLANVSYGLDVSGVNRQDARQRARATLESVGLTGFDTRLPSELSGGQQQRVAVARALVLEPQVLLFDEPLSNLDARLRRQMREEIRDLQQRLALTVIYVTHDQAEALAVSDRIIVMNRAVIAQEGAPAELYRAPKDAFVAGFMGEANRVRAILARRDAALADVAIGPLTVTIAHRGIADGEIDVAIRPEAVVLRPAGSTPLAGRVRKAAYLGSVMEYTIDTPVGALFAIDGAVDRPLPVGSDVAVALAPHGVIAMPAG